MDISGNLAGFADRSRLENMLQTYAFPAEDLALVDAVMEENGFHTLSVSAKEAARMVSVHAVRQEHNTDDVYAYLGELPKSTKVTVLTYPGSKPAFLIRFTFADIKSFAMANLDKIDDQQEFWGMRISEEVTTRLKMMKARPALFRHFLGSASDFFARDVLDTVLGLAGTSGSNTSVVDWIGTASDDQSALSWLSSSGFDRYVSEILILMPSEARS